MQDLAHRCDLRKGNVIDGRFTIEDELGLGTFGNVYRVRDKHDNVYALKLLRLWEVHPELRKGLVERFDMEYETGRIKSDYLVHSVSHGLLNGNPYIVMEYCSGGDLVWATKNQTLDYSYVAFCVLKGLDALHRQGKVHRDLKPENVLKKNDGKFALTDFGICGDRNKRMTERNILGKPKQLFGTYAYMPPEQVKPSRGDATVLPTTDIFSFGVMMYQVLTGQLPFGTLKDEYDLPSYLRNTQEGKWNKNKLTHSNASEWIPLIENCLAPKIEDRIQNVQEAIAYLPNRKNFSTEHETYNDYSQNVKNGILLRIMQGQGYGMAYYLNNMIMQDHPIIHIGRQDEGYQNDINLEDHDCYMSRFHCTLEYYCQNKNWILRDGQWRRINDRYMWTCSKNGTYINSSKISARGQSIVPGDIISIGETKIRVEAY